ncbi:MAG: Rossmann-like domain-containing protein [Syntrophobacteria bacterium]
MRILQQLLHSLKTDHPVNALGIGPHLVAVGSQQLGLAASMHSSGRTRPVTAPTEAENLVGKNARELAGWLLEDNWFRASIGMAALNSLLVPRHESLIEANAKQVISSRAAGRDLALVGHFPFVEELRSRVRNLWVMEKQPRAGDLSEEEGYQVLAEADVVAITGTSLINHTFERILASCAPQSFKIMLGPSAPLSPVVLDFGIDVIGGTLVEKTATVLAMVEGGASFRRLNGIRTVILAKDVSTAPDRCC